MLDVRRLRVLREFAARGTIAAAADALAYTPSAVSQHLAQLEREAGVPLFRRSGRRLQLTDAGQALVGHAGAVLERLERAEADLAAHAGEVRGTVTVGAFQTAALALVLPALAPLARRHPGLEVRLAEMEAEESLPLVQAGRLDLAIAEEYAHAARPHAPDLDRIYLPPDEMVVALPPDHPATKLGDPVSLAALSDVEWATVGTDTAMAQMFAGLCRAVGGFEPRVRHTAHDFGVLIELVVAGHSAAMLPALGHPERHPGVAVRRLAEGDFPRSLFIARRAADEQRPATRAVIAALTEVAGA